MSALFKMKVVARRNDPYYYTNWTGAIPVSVVAENEQDAVNKACALMGKAPDYRHWVARLLSVEPVPEKE